MSMAGCPHSRRYTPWLEFLSRPIHGHTPRKLPAFAAISRIIAVRPHRRPAIIRRQGRVCQEFFCDFSWHFRRFFDRMRRKVPANLSGLEKRPEEDPMEILAISKFDRTVLPGMESGMGPVDTPLPLLHMTQTQSGAAPAWLPDPVLLPYI